MRLKKDNKGRLVVELVLVLPFLLLLVLVSSEITHYVRCRQAVAVLVSEAGKSVFKSCRDFLEAPTTPVPVPRPTTPIPPSYQITQDRTKMCVDDVMSRPANGGVPASGFAAFANQLAPYLKLAAIDIRVTVYAYSTTMTGRPGNLSVLYSYPQIGGRPSKYTISGGGSITGPAPSTSTFVSSQFAINHQRFVIAEGFFDFNGVFSKAFKVGTLGNGEVYDAAIF